MLVLTPVESAAQPKQENEVVFLFSFFDEMRQRYLRRSDGQPDCSPVCRAPGDPVTPGVTSACFRNLRLNVCA